MRTEKPKQHFVQYGDKKHFQCSRRCLYFVGPNGRKANSSYRMVISGIQCEVSPIFNFRPQKKIESFVSAGGILWYNTTNRYNQLAFLYPGLTDYPIPVIALDQDGLPLWYFSFGYILRVGLGVQIAPKSHLSIAVSSQNDT